MLNLKNFSSLVVLVYADESDVILNTSDCTFNLKGKKVNFEYALSEARSKMDDLILNENNEHITVKIICVVDGIEIIMFEEQNIIFEEY